MSPVFDADNPGEYVQFQPKTDAELSLGRLLPAGEYDYQVSSSKDAVSKKGNPMIAIELQVFTGDGHTRSIKDWLMESMAFKLKHFCYGNGLANAYDAGEFTAEQLIGRTGKVILKVEEQEGFPPRNSVKDYVATTSATPVKVASAAVQPVSSADEPPF